MDFVQPLPLTDPDPEQVGLLDLLRWHHQRGDGWFVLEIERFRLDVGKFAFGFAR